MSLSSAYQIYEKLMQGYEFRVQAARDAHAKVARAFLDCVEGKGTGPSHHLMVEAQHLEEELREQLKAIEAHLADTFGPE